MNAAPGSADDLQRRRWEWLALARFFLAGIVVLFHIQRRLNLWQDSWLSQLDGRVAVIAFLLISGYSISASLTQRQDGFYRRRLLRVYPLLIGALIFTELVTALSPRAYPSAGIPVMIGNLVAPPGHLCLVPTLNIPLWSLGCEIVFYALAPLFFRASTGLLAAFVFLSMRAYWSPLVNEWLYGAPTLCFLWCWLLGFMLHSRRSPILMLITAAAVGLLWKHPLLRYAPASVLGQYLITLVIMVSPWLPPLGRWPAALVNYLGAISFPLYLVHFPVVIYSCDTVKSTSPGLILAWVMFVTLLFHHFLDVPLQGVIHGRSRHPGR